RALGSRDIGRIHQNGNADGLGHQLVQNCQSLSGQLIREKIDPRQVSARPGEVGDQTKLDRVFADTEDDRNLRCRSFGSKRSIVTAWRSDTGQATSTGVSHESRKFTTWTLHRSSLQIEIHGHNKLSLTVALPQRNGLGTLVLIVVAKTYALF